MFYITISHVKTFIEELNKRHGESVNILNYGQLESALEKPKLVLYQNNIYPEIYQKAAVLMEAINKLHTLTDGNKRTAMLSSEYFVNENKCHLILPLKATRLSVDVAKDKDDLLSNEIQKWFKTHVATNPHQLYVMLSERIEEEAVIQSLMEKGKYNDAKKLISDWLAFEIYPENEEGWGKYVEDWKDKEKISKNKQVSANTSKKWRKITQLAQYEVGKHEHDEMKLPEKTPENLQFKGHSIEELEKNEKLIQKYEDEMENQKFDAESFFAEGVRLDLFGYGEEAIACYERILKEDNTNYHVFLHIGLTLQYRLEKYSEAIESYEKFLKNEPEDIHALSCMSQAEFELKNYEKVIKILNKILKLNNNDKYANSLLAITLAELGRLDESYAYFEKLLKVDSNDLEILENYGIALSENENPKKAIPYFERAIQIEPKDYSTRYNIAVTFSRTGQLQKAIENYKKSVELNPQNSSAIGGLAASLSNYGKYEEAKPYAEQAIKLKPKDSMFLTNMGVILFNLKEYAKAIEYVKKSYKIDPNDTRTVLMYYQVLLGEKKEEELFNIMKKDIEKNPKIKEEIKNTEGLNELQKNPTFEKILS